MREGSYEGVVRGEGVGSSEGGEGWEGVATEEMREGRVWLWRSSGRRIRMSEAV